MSHSLRPCAGEFQFLYILASTCYLAFFFFFFNCSRPSRCEMLSHCLICSDLMTNDVCICSLAICI